MVALSSTLLEAIPQPSGLADLLAWIIGGSVVYNVVIIIYRLTLHPLAQYPGRFIDKISAWPTVIQCVRGDRHVKILLGHDKYGTVIRTGPNSLSFNSATALVAIYGSRDANVRRADWYETLDAPSGSYSTQSTMSKKEHAFRRRVLDQAFSTKAVRDSEKYIDQRVRQFVQCMGENLQEDGWSKPVNFDEWITYFGFDVIGSLSFGSSFNLMEHDANRYIPEMLVSTNKFLYYFGYIPYMSNFRSLLSTRFMGLMTGQTGRDALKFFQMAGRKMESRKAEEENVSASEKGEGRRDIFHYLFRGRDPESGLGFTSEQLEADAGLLIGAGSDAIASTLSSAMFYLLANPATLGKLTAEVRSSCETIDEICLPKINNLHYLRAVVDETLRMSPAAPSAFPRTVLPGGLDVDGLHIPEGITLGVSPYAIHHNEAYFPDSWSFSPERWLELGGKASQNRKAFCPFSLGPMNCVGKNTAYLACQLLLGKLLHQYDVRYPGDKLTGGGGPHLEVGRHRESEYQMLDHIVGYRNGPVVQFKLRSS